MSNTRADVTPGQPPATTAEPTGSILIVEDEPELLRGYARTLTAAGHDVEVAADGQAAVILLTQREFDLVLSDIAMPNLDGIQLLRAVRQRDLDLPVILMTANPTVETAAHSVEAGAFRYLVKPIDPRGLREIVGKALRVHRLARVKRQALAHLEITGMQIDDRAGLEVRFSSALKSLWMAYQPIVSWSERRVVAYEALVRSAEPALPHPGALFDAAERLGRLNDLGRAIRASVANSTGTVPGNAQIFVNLHTRDLMDDLLFQSDAPLSKMAGRVVLEITERASLDVIADIRSRVAALRKMGFRIAIDDLGAGYAGLTSFAQLEPEVVKLDMSLVRDIHKESTRRKLVRSMASLCIEMGIKVVAEGVETVEERDVVSELGCDLLQGYLFAKPGRPFPEVQFPAAKTGA